eukprot:TRINITY_DN7389_c0_g1_i1.p1 TRINITY_DN7389_c0_g1~~TRINITY_DN7389_c0_g1_i1.p1  ORF type:complete len:690 (+),score=96.47 TRINITY_DN7389_c0_g1_i1:63-2132(+)
MVNGTKQRAVSIEWLYPNALLDSPTEAEWKRPTHENKILVIGSRTNPLLRVRSSSGPYKSIRIEIWILLDSRERHNFIVEDNIAQMSLDGMTGIFSKLQIHPLKIIQDQPSINASWRLIIDDVAMRSEPILLLSASFRMYSYLDPTKRQTTQQTPQLHLACGGQIRRSASEIKKRLDQPNVSINDLDINHYTPVYWAAWAGRGDVIDYLIREDCDLKRPPLQGFTLLHVAAHKGDLPLLKRILPHLLDQVNKVDCYGNSALHIAAAFKHAKIVDFLLSQKIDKRIINTQNATAMTLAAGQTSILATLNAAENVEPKSMGWKQKITSWFFEPSAENKSTSLITEIAIIFKTLSDSSPPLFSAQPDLFVKLFQTLWTYDSQQHPSFQRDITETLALFESYVSAIAEPDFPSEFAFVIWIYLKFKQYCRLLYYRTTDAWKSLTVICKKLEYDLVDYFLSTPRLDQIPEGTGFLFDELSGIMTEHFEYIVRHGIEWDSDSFSFQFDMLLIYAKILLLLNRTEQLKIVWRQFWTNIYPRFPATFKLDTILAKRLEAVHGFGIRLPLCIEAISHVRAPIEPTAVLQFLRMFPIESADFPQFVEAFSGHIKEADDTKLKLWPGVLIHIIHLLNDMKVECDFSRFVVMTTPLFDKLMHYGHVTFFSEFEPVIRSYFSDAFQFYLSKKKVPLTHLPQV